MLAPTLFSIFFSIMLRQAKDGICIRFLKDDSLFHLRRLLTHMKTIEKLIIELLFANDCTLPAHMEETLQHIANCFSDAAKNFGLTVSLKKTKVFYQPLPQEVHSPP